jgi:hypothetical protein
VVATLRRLLEIRARRLEVGHYTQVPCARRLEVDRQVELAELVGLAESKLRVAVATLRRLPVALQRLRFAAGELERLRCFELRVPSKDKCVRCCVQEEHMRIITCLLAFCLAFGASRF